jgi:hypothetical protein
MTASPIPCPGTWSARPTWPRKKGASHRTSAQLGLIHAVSWRDARERRASSQEAIALKDRHQDARVRELLALFGSGKGRRVLLHVQLERQGRRRFAQVVVLLSARKPRREYAGREPDDGSRD